MGAPDGEGAFKAIRTRRGPSRVPVQGPMPRTGAVKFYAGRTSRRFGGGVLCFKRKGWPVGRAMQKMGGAGPKDTGSRGTRKGQGCESREFDTKGAGPRLSPEGIGRKKAKDLAAQRKYQ